MIRRVGIIGGGAAGCFCAIEIKRRCPSMEVTVYEAGLHPMAKLAVTGGGRCNFTNTFEGISKLEEAYPRGANLMKRALKVFSNEDVVRWFAKEGIASITQDDGCIFPKSQDAMQIVRTLEKLMRSSGVKLVCGRRIGNIGELSEDIVVVTAGGTSSATLKSMLPEDVAVTDTVPSLFTFKVDDAPLRTLMGTVAPSASVSLAGTKFKANGALLITDWGTSGPATLKLSSYAAAYLAEHNYEAGLLVNWTGESESELRSWAAGTASACRQKMIFNTPPDGISSRLWKHLLMRSGLRENMRWSEIGSKGLNKLINNLISDQYRILGRARFKEEFVTCGGVDLSGIDLNSLESRNHPGLYFAGEVLDIDAITGGFNLQAAWSTAFCVAKAIAKFL